MKTLTLKEAHEIITNCSACIINRDALMYPSFDDLTGDHDNEFLYLGWTDGDGYEFSIKCIEENNRNVMLTDEGSLILKDNEGEEFEFLPLSPMKID